MLMCVLKLGEGVDLPHTRTVFLTTPTASEIRLRQMLGRALRGPAVGGTEVANLVAFIDDGSRLRDWRDPFTLVPDLARASLHYQERSPRPRSKAPAWPAAQDGTEQMRLSATAPTTESDEAVAARVACSEGLQCFRARAMRLPLLEPGTRMGRRYQVSEAGRRGNACHNGRDHPDGTVLPRGEMARSETAGPG